MRAFPFAVFVISLSLLVPTPGRAQHIKCIPCWYGFGKVQIGTSATYSIELANKGTANLKIESISGLTAPFSLGSFSLPAEVAPGSSVELPLVFTPTTRGQIHDTFTIASNDPESPLTVHIYGVGLSAAGVQLTVSPATLNFGDVTVGSSATMQATLSASGGTVDITSDQTNSSEFVILSPTLPVKIPSGQSVQATIQFTPDASGTANAKGGFFSNADDSPTFDELTGTGVPTSSHDAYLTWDAGAQNIVGYNVYRGNTHGGPYSQINSSLDANTNYTDYTVSGGKTYFYVATEVNSEGQESSYSNEVKIKVPSN
jgi:Abnormal spindle-like microcephaly-assoc'd, ASPM-SPD-2-Hydin